MKIKLIQNERDNVWFIQMQHGSKRRHFSLKTKDPKIAKRLYDDVSYEVTLINLYTKIIGDLNAIRKEVGIRLQKLSSLVDINTLISEKPYRTEADIERLACKNLWELGLNLIGRQVRLCGNGKQKGCVVDILALDEHSNKKVVIEIKKVIKESHLGQCLRYLDLPDIELVYLIGETVDNSVNIFKNFNIRIFTINKGGLSIFTPFIPSEHSK